MFDTMCRTFGWQEPPWEEPSERHGIDTSISATRYNVLIYIAWGIEQIGETFEAEQNLDQVIRVVQEARGLASDEQALIALQQGCKIYPQLIGRSVQYTWYLPVDFAVPIHPTVNIPNWDGTHFQEIPAFGSSVRLQGELERLLPIIHAIIARKGKGMPISSFHGSYTWDGIADAGETLRKAAQDSLRLNLPIYISV